MNTATTHKQKTNAHHSQLPPHEGIPRGSTCPGLLIAKACKGNISDSQVRYPNPSISAHLCSQTWYVGYILNRLGEGSRV